LASASSATEVFYVKGGEEKAAQPLFPPHLQKTNISFPEPAEG
jgi:hypothetical protein